MEQSLNSADDQRQIQIKADDATLKGNYANLAMIGHSREEFSIDFINIIQNQGILTSRVIMSPGHAKRLSDALKANLEQYEKNFNVKIESAEEPKKSIGFTD
jgi:hypothetical protein